MKYRVKGGPYWDKMRAFEKDLLLQAMAEMDNNISACARYLKLNRKSLSQMLTRHGIPDAPIPTLPPERKRLLAASLNWPIGREAPHQRRRPYLPR